MIVQTENEKKIDSEWYQKSQEQSVVITKLRSELNSEKAWFKKEQHEKERLLLVIEIIRNKLTDHYEHDKIVNPHYMLDLIEEHCGGGSLPKYEM